MRKPPSAGGYAAGRDEHSRQQGGGKGGKGGRDGPDSCQEALAEAKAKAAARAWPAAPPGIDPSIGDWRCPSCDNWNWARRFDVPCLRHLRLSSKAYLPCAHHGFSPPLAVLRHRALTATQCARTVASRCSHRRQCNKCGAKHPTKAPPPPRAADRKADQAMGLDTVAPTSASEVPIGGRSARRGRRLP